MSYMLRDFFYKLPTNLVRSFTGTNAPWHLLAIVLTYALVVSGFDWWYFESTRGQLIFDLAFPTAMLGFFVPAFIPVGVYLYGVIRKSNIIKILGAAQVQAALLGLFISFIYKAFTGRLHPNLISAIGSPDISRVFEFGFLRNGVFWGWPSSHTTVAFAMAAALIAFFPRKRLVIALALIYAFYIGFGVSVTIHWFSDFIAGAIIGSVIGFVVGRSFRARAM